MIRERILIADDDESLRWVLKRSLSERGYTVTCAKDGVEALRFIKESPFALCLLDIKMPGIGGLEVLKQIMEIERGMPVIIITAQDTMKNAIEAMKMGAFDYINKPFDLDELEIVVDKAIESYRLRKEVSNLKGQWVETLQKEAVIVGKSPAMQKVFKTVGKVAGKDVAVLITGESGTGKELLAKVIHRESKRASGPFIPINSAAIPRDLIESELFGYERGAFTGAISERPGKLELADGGTLFLDEIGDMGLETQVKILRVLQEREFFRLGGKRPIKVDIRLITATNQDLKKLMEQGRFREDLFYRIDVVNIELPPLRERKEDIPLLARHFLTRFEEEMGMGVKVLTEEAVDSLMDYDWPGNVRELENTLKGAYLLSSGPAILKDHLSFFSRLKEKELKSLSDKKGVSPSTQTIEDFFSELLKKIVPKAKIYIKGDLYQMVISGVEKTLIRLVLETTRGNQLQASRILGINRNTLRKKIKELRIRDIEG